MNEERGEVHDTVYDEVVAAPDAWDDVADRFDGRAGFIATRDNGSIAAGEYREVTAAPGTMGVLFDLDLFDGPTRLTAADRDEHGFYFSDEQGSAVELKYCSSDEFPAYPEPLHMHNVPELYMVDGRFTMTVATEPSAAETTDLTIKDELFVAPAGLYHGIRDRSRDSRMVVMRGDPGDPSQRIGKWGTSGEQLYDHLTPVDVPPRPQLIAYDPDEDTRYRL